MSFSIPSAGGYYSSVDLDPGVTGYVQDKQTYFAWVKATSTDTVGFTAWAAGTGRFAGHSYNAGVRGFVYSTSNFQTNSVTLAASTWTPVCIRVDRQNADSKYILCDVPGEQGVRSIAITAPDGTGYQLFFGTNPNVGSPLFTGKLAHLTHWDGLLSDSEVANLMDGADPATIQRELQLSYWDGNSVTDEIAGYTVSASGGATIDTDDNPPISGGGFTITSVGGDDQYYPAETNVALELSEAVTLASCTLDDGVTTPVDQPLTGGAGTANQTFTSVQGDNPYTKDHNGNQLGSRPKLTFTASE